MSPVAGRTLLKPQSSTVRVTQTNPATAKDDVMAERLIFKNVQRDSFPDVSTLSHLLSLSPKFDEVSQLIWVVGGLRHAEGLKL